MTQNLIGGDAQSVWGYVMGEVLIPAARDMIYDAFSGGLERMIFGDSSTRDRRSRGRGPIGHTPYHRMASPTGRHVRDDGPRRDVPPRRSRRSDSLDEIILGTRVEAEEVLDRLDDLCDRYENVTVADLYGLVGIPSTPVDDRWGWVDMRGASVSRVRNGYLLNLPRPEPID